MSYLLSQVPLIAPTGAIVSLADIATDTDSPEVAEALAIGDITQLYTKFNQHAGRLDALSRAAGGSYGILDGCTVAAVGASSLNVTIADGYALLDGLVEVSGLPPITLPASTARVWLWLKQDGTWTSTPTATPPAGKVLYLGSATTSGTEVTSVNATDGVIRLRGGVPWTQSSDSGYPTASPSSSQMLFCRTNGGNYVWTGFLWAPLQVRQNITLAHPRTNMSFVPNQGTLAGMAISNSSQSEIHFSLCAAPEPGIYEYKGIAFYGGDQNRDGTGLNFKVHLLKATAGTGVPSTVANTTAHVLAAPADWRSRWNQYTWGGSQAILDLRDSPYYWVSCQQESFTGGTLTGIGAAEVPGILSTRPRDFRITRSGTALTYAGGLPISGGAFDPTNITYTDIRADFHLSAANMRLANMCWSVMLQRIG